MVVLISALNFVSYLLIKIVGAQHGIGLAGVLGGLISSTAVTLGFAQRSREPEADAPALAEALLAAGVAKWAFALFGEVPVTRGESAVILARGVALAGTQTARRTEQARRVVA